MAIIGRAAELVSLGAPEAAIQILTEVPVEARGASSPGIQSKFVWTLFRAHWENNDWRSAEDIFKTYSAPPSSHRDHHRARMELWAIWGGLYEGRDSAWASKRLVDLAEENGNFANDTLLLAEFSYLRAYLAYRYLGKIDDAMRSVDLAVALFDHIGERSQLAKTLSLQTVIRKATGSLSAARRSSQLGLQSSLRLGNPYLLAVSITQCLICAYRTGSFGEAIELADSLQQLGSLYSFPKWGFHAHLALARVSLLRGELEAATDHLERAASRASSSDLSGVTATLQEYRAELCVLAGDAAEALHLLGEAEEALGAASANSYELAELNLRRAEAWMELGKYHDVVSECELALDRMDGIGQTLERGHILRVMGLAKHSLGRPTEASELFERSERELRRVGDIFELGKLLVDKAELSRGDAESRVADAAEAVNLLQRVGVENELERARDVLSLTQTVLRRQNSIRVNFEDHEDQAFIAESDAMKTLLADARVCGRSGVPALITGETGVGKEVFARYIHDHSDRSKKPFVAVNCAAVPETLFEREFFGHSKGAFTGADRDRQGLLEAADGGTLFLDEIGELAYPMQSKLLRVLQEGTYRRVGETRERAVDLRIISATNRRLEDRVKENSFREDLYYRLAWFEFEIPPLRSRQEDLTALALHFLAQQSRRMEMPFWIDKFAWACLRRYSWPGNIRELESAIGSGCARAGADGCVQVEHLPTRVAKEQPLHEQPDSDLNLAVALEKKERELILEALRRTGHQRTAAAKLLGIGRNTLYDKMKRLIVDPEASRRNAANG